MMLTSKLRWALLGFLLLSLSGCGEKKSEERVERARVAEAPIRESVPVPVSTKKEAPLPTTFPECMASTTQGEEVIGMHGLPFSLADFRSELTRACSRELRDTSQPDMELDHAKMESYCGCVTEEMFGGVENTRVAEWISDQSRNCVMYRQIAGGNLGPRSSRYINIKRDILQLERKWYEIYARSENICMQKLGVNVRHVIVSVF
jgi:hypothetical protein